MKKSRKKKIIKHPIQNIKILIFAIGIIMVWRGVWNLLDHYFLPDMFVFSNILAIIIGIIILLSDDLKITELHSK